jgi:2-polyprenyl-3-methyl-5-hydroxy-6-metoxy-1,4-benzoquinol methylase
MKYFKNKLKNIFNLNFTHRDEVTKRFLSSGSWTNAIDVGGRRSVILNYIQCKNKYILDFHNKASPDFKGKAISHNLEQGLPLCKGEKWDLIIANDVIEHVENKNKLVNDIFQNCKSDIVIALPNTQHYRFVNGLITGEMGKQYIFNIPDGSDRHRWVTFYRDNIEWLQNKAIKAGFELINYEDVDFLTNKRQLWYLISKYRKQYFVINQVFHFKKIN